MTDPDIERIAKLMGARIVGKIPGPLHGALGAANAAHYYKQHMQKVHAEQAAARGESGEQTPLAVPVQRPTKQTLEELAAAASTATQPLDAERVAGAVLDAVVSKIAGRIQGPGQLADVLSRLGFPETPVPGG